MMKAEKDIPELRFPEFEGEWKYNLLSDILTFKNGINASKEEYGFGYKFINVLDIINNDFITYDKIIGSVNVSESEFRKNIVEYGDVLFQRSSETREEVGQANVYLDNSKPATFGGFVIRGKKKTEYNPLFLNYLLKTQKARNEITTKSGGSTRYNVGQETLSAVGVFMANLDEQQKIASFLSSVDQRIQLLTRKKEQLEHYKKGIMQQIFSQQLRFKDEQGKEYPEWEEKRLGDICNYKNGNSFENRVNPDGRYFLITLNSIDIQGRLKPDHKRIDETDNSLEKGDLVMVLSDVALGNILGLTDIIPSDCFVLNQRMGALKPIILVNSYYLKTFINSNQRYFKLMGQGSSQKNLSKDDILNFYVLLPLLPEQQKIASFFSSIDDKITHVNTQIEQTRKWKQGLLQKMFV